MRRLGLVIAIAAAATSALALDASVALASPSGELDKGRFSFKARDYDSAIKSLNLVLYPEPQLTRASELVEAYILFGASLYETGSRDRARREFQQALQLEPDRSISTLQFSEGAVRLFDDVKTELAAQKRRQDEAKRIAEAKAAIEAYKKSLVVYEATPFGYNFLPFGIAQFSQKRYVPGTLFAAGQVATLAANVSIYVYLVGTYGFRNEGLTIQEGIRARRLQQVQVGTGIAFLGLYGLSIFDAIRHYKPRLRVDGDDSLIPDELRDQGETPAPKKGDRKLKKVSLADRIWGGLQLAPMISDESVGIGIGWEND
jgi:tetratricopeptide (TPR) repeat protein